jgi:nucleoside-diphosphate-sugar epimerase
MKFVITGGCGFIGQVLTREILQRGEFTNSLLWRGGT